MQKRKREGNGKHLLHKDLSIMLSAAQSTGNPLSLEVNRRSKLLLSDCLWLNWFAPALIPYVPGSIGLVKLGGSMGSSYKIESERSSEGQPVASIKNLKTNSLWRNVRLDSSEAGSSSCGCN